MDKPTEEDKLLINTVFQSGLTKFKIHDFCHNATWFRHGEVSPYLIDIIKEQTYLESL